MNIQRRTYLSFAGALGVWILLPSTANGACPGQNPPSPLVLDLDDGGIHTTPIEMPVLFDLDADGLPEHTTWINPGTGDAFLVLDVNQNGSIDDGRELFGTATLLPGGGEADNGFEALAVYDEPAYGGNGDGVITVADQAWARLRLWRDSNYNGFSEAAELKRLTPEGVVAIALQFTELNYTDGNLNKHWLRSVYLKRIARPNGAPPGPPIYRLFKVEDILFWSIEDSQ